MQDQRNPNHVAVVAILLLFGAIFFVLFALVIQQLTPESHRKSDESSNEMKSYIEKVKTEREQWEQENPQAANRLNDPYIHQDLYDNSSTRVPGTERHSRVRGERLELERKCGAPDFVTFDKNQRASVYRYNSGPCKGIYGFNQDESLVIAGDH